MSVEVQHRPSPIDRIGKLFSSRGGKRSSRIGEAATATKDTLLHDTPREAGVAGAGDLEDRNPIQNVAGTGISVNQPQAAPGPSSTAAVEKKGGTEAIHRQEDSKPGEGSRAPSQRRGSDEEVVEAGPSTARPNVDEIEEEQDDSADDNDDDNTARQRIEFYRKDRPFFWLSNSSEHPVVLDGVRYPTAEHLFQAMKFLPHRNDVVTKIRKTSSPTDAIKESRKNMADVKRGWIGKGGNVAAMREVLLLKFSQHSALRRQLLLTGDAELVEVSPTDPFWGTSQDAESGFGVGRNELGKALAKTRETLRIQSGLGIGSGAKTI